MIGKTILATTSILLDREAGNFFFENQAKITLDCSHPRSGRVPPPIRLPTRGGILTSPKRRLAELLSLASTCPAGAIGTPPTLQTKRQRTIISSVQVWRQCGTKLFLWRAKEECPCDYWPIVNCWFVHVSNVVCYDMVGGSVVRRLAAAIQPVIGHRLTGDAAGSGADVKVWREKPIAVVTVWHMVVVTGRVGLTQSCPSKTCTVLSVTSLNCTCSC